MAYIREWIRWSDSYIEQFAVRCPSLIGAWYFFYFYVSLVTINSVEKCCGVGLKKAGRVGALFIIYYCHTLIFLSFIKLIGGVLWCGVTVCNSELTSE